MLGCGRSAVRGSLAAVVGLRPDDHIHWILLVANISLKGIDCSSTHCGSIRLGVRLIVLGGRLVGRVTAVLLL